MKNIIIGALSGVVVVLLVLLIIPKNNIVTLSQVAVTSKPTTLPTIVPTATPIPSTAPTPIPTMMENEHSKILKDKKDKKLKLYDSQDKDIFNEKECVLTSDNIGVCLEGIQVLPEGDLYFNGKFHILIDFSLINMASEGEYENTYGAYILQDASRHTYSPVLNKNTTGEATGILRPRDFKRGQIAFYPAYTGNEYTLIYRNHNDTIKYKIDVSKYFNSRN